MASKIGIIIEREYKTRVLKKSFLVMTLMGPLLMLLMMSAPALLATLGGDDEQLVAVLDHTGKYGDVLVDTEDFKFVPATESLDSYRDKADQAEVSGVLEIRQDLREDPNAITLISFKTLPSGIENYINSRFSEEITREKLLSHKVEGIEEIIRSSETKISVKTFKIGEDGEQEFSSSAISMALGFVLTMMIYMFISLYGSSVLQSVMEEKKSRIMEVMVSSVRPFELMMGKIIGVGAVGLTQIAIWGILLTLIMQFGQFFFVGSLDSSLAMNNATMPSMEGLDMRELMLALMSLNFFEIFVCFVLYFIGGFLVYASIFAALGSAVSSDEDAQGLMWPITIIMLFSFYTGFACIDAPNSPLAVITSYIPFTSPVVMMIRIPYGVSLWEEVLSLALLYASFVGFTYLGAKVYRVGVLMYGKKPKLKDIWRWLREGA